MSPRRFAVLALAGVAVAVGGFLLAQALGGDSPHTGSEALPSTVSVDDSGSRIPNFPAHGRLPTLEVSTVTSEAGTATEAGSEYQPEPEYQPEAEYVAPKEEKQPYVPPSNPPTAAPEVTVGQE